MPRRRILIGLTLTLVAAACGKSSDDHATKNDTPPPPPHHVGVDPEKFDCTSLAPAADLAAVLGGTPHAMDSGTTPPRGIAKACSYLVSHGDAGAQEAWTFDLDCRPGYDKRAELMFAQYTQNSADQVAAYQAQTQGKPGSKPPTDDAGVPLRAPGDAHVVEVGKKALDHHGEGLLFVDDDAPCYVRVVGPDAARRLALAQLIAKNLHADNAPIGVP